MTTGGRFTFVDMQIPLFLHPSDGTLFVSIQKLEGGGDFRSWKHSFEIQLSSKRKLGFVNQVSTQPIEPQFHYFFSTLSTMLILSFTRQLLYINTRLM